MNYYKNKNIAIGNFDLIHKGHQLVYKNADLIITFKNIPKKKSFVFTCKSKKRFFKSINKKVIFFDLKKKNMLAIDFYNKYLSKAKNIYVGENFIFGSDQVSVIDFIKKNNIKNIHTVKLIKECSSTIIKKYLVNGEIEKANKLLIKPYSVKSIVKRGNKLGRKIGYPTINFYFDNHNKPILPYGVYITQTRINNKLYKSVSFYGIPQSVGDNEKIRFETYIIGLNRNLYYKNIRIYIYKKIADVKKFKNIDLLKQAISNYVSKAKKFDFFI